MTFSKNSYTFLYEGYTAEKSSRTLKGFERISNLQLKDVLKPQCFDSIVLGREQQVKDMMFVVHVRGKRTGSRVPLLLPMDLVNLTDSLTENLSCNEG
jgi:hypothetical protein